MPWTLLLQVILLIVWYTVPAAAALPWWAVFLPALLLGAWLGILLLSFIAACVGIGLGLKL